MSPVDRTGPFTESNFTLGSYEKFQPGFRKTEDELWRTIRGTQPTWRNTKMLTFGPILPSVTLKAVSLQLNGMLMMWKIQRAMQDDAIWAAKKFFGKSFSPLTEIAVGKTEISGTRASPPSRMNTSKILQRV